MTTGEPFVSVVTPFYNTDPYLAECIESVLAQTYRNFEYVLVDNHSTDRSGEIAQEYAKRDPRIRFVRADLFRPQIPNYNYTIRQASPETRYIKFASADDWLYPRCLTEMVEVAEAHPRAAVISAYDLVGDEVQGSGVPSRLSVMPGREAGRLYFLKWLFPFGSPTSVMYRGDVVRARTPFFPEGTLHADTEVIFQILAEYDFAFVHQVLSFIRTQEDSITQVNADLSDNALDRLLIVKKYGRLYLNDAEYNDVLADTQRWYYDDLGRQLVHRWMGKKNDKVWEFQQKGLSTIGETLDWGGIRRSAVRSVVRRLLNPLQFRGRFRQIQNDHGLTANAKR